MDVRLLLKCPNVKRYASGQPITGSDGEKELYIMICGTVVAEPASNEPGMRVGPGRSLNMRSFLFGEKGHVFTAAEDALICVLTREDFISLLSAKPRLYREFLREAYAKPDELERMNRESRMYANMLERPEAASPKQPAVKKPAIKKPAAQKPATKKPDAQLPVPEPAQVKKAAHTGVPAGFFLDGHKGYPGIVHPEYRAFVFDKDYTCPNCGKKIRGCKVFQSKLAVEKEPRYDLRQYYIDFQQEWYDVTTCPLCLFSAFPGLFAEPKNFSKSIIQDRLASLAGSLSPNAGVDRSLDDVFAGHYLALQCADAFLQHRSIKAKLWGNLSWLYEDIHEDALAVEAARRAAEANEQLYMESSLTPVQEQMIALVIAGMQYRAGQRADVRKWLFKVKTNREGKQAYADLGEKLLELLREETDGTGGG